MGRTSSLHYSNRIAAQVEGHKSSLSFMPKSTAVKMGTRPSFLEMPREQYESLLKNPLKKQD